MPGAYFWAGRNLIKGGAATGERVRTSYNAFCYHQICDDFDARRDLTGAAQEGSIAYALGRGFANASI